MSTSLTDKLKAAQAKAKAASDTKTKAQTATGAPEASAFAISDSEISKNPAYQIVTDDSKTIEARVAELVKLRAYNKELTAEQNQKNLETVGQLLIYFENSVMAAAREGNQFTNDDALSLFDEMVKSLQGRLVNYTGYIKPFVKAFDVMQRAREGGLPPHELLAAVQELKDKQKALETTKAAKAEEIAAKEAEFAPINERALELTNKLERYEADKAAAIEAKAAAESTLKAELEKFWLTRDKNVVEAAEMAIERANTTIRTCEQGMTGFAAPAEMTAKQMANAEEQLKALKAELEAIEADIAKTVSELTQDEDTVAIGRLIEITGAAFKEEREKIVALVNSIQVDSVSDIEKTAARFSSGQAELKTVGDKVQNIGYYNRIVFQATKKAKESDDSLARDLDAQMAAIKAEKGDEAYFDPNYEVANKLKLGVNTHDRTADVFTAQSGQIQGLISEQMTGFTATSEGLRQKEADCMRLRTTTAVKTSTQTLTIMKALELATASERLAATDAIMSEMDKTSQEAFTHIFTMVSNNQTAEGDRLMQAIKKSLEAADEIDRFTKDVAQKSREQDIARRALHEAQDAAERQAEKLAGTRAEVSREVAASPDLENQVTATAARAIGVDVAPN